MAPKKEAAPKKAAPVVPEVVPEPQPVDEAGVLIAPPEPDPECEVTPEVVEEGAIEPEDFNADEPTEAVSGEYLWNGEHVTAFPAEEGYIDVIKDDGNEAYVPAEFFADAVPYVARPN